MSHPRFDIKSAHEQYTRMKKSASVFDYFQEPMELELAGSDTYQYSYEGIRGEALFPYTPTPSMERLKFNSKERNYLASVARPWFDAALDKAPFVKPPLSQEAASAASSTEHTVTFSKTLYALEYYYGGLDPSFLQIKRVIEELDALRAEEEDIEEKKKAQSQQFSHNLKKDLAQQLRKKKIPNSKNPFDSKALKKSLDFAEKQLKEILNKEIANALLDGKKQERKDTTWITFITEVFNTFIAIVAFYESVVDLVIAQNKFLNQNTWLDTALVNRSTLIADLKKLESMALANKAKQSRDKKAGKQFVAMPEEEFKEFLADKSTLDKTEAAILDKIKWQDKNGKNIYTTPDGADPIPEVSLNDYHNALWKSLQEKFDRTKDAEIDQLSQSQFVQLMIALEKRYAERLIQKSENEILDRNNLYVYRTIRDNEKSKQSILGENIATINMLAAKSDFYDKLMEPHRNNDAWMKQLEVDSYKIIAWEQTEEDVLKPLKDSIVEHERRMFARLVLFIGFALLLAAMILVIIPTTVLVASALAVIVPMIPFIAAAIAVAGGISIFVGQLIRRDAETEAKNCFVNIHEKRKNKQAFNELREQAKYEAVKGQTLFGNSNNRANENRQEEAPPLLDEVDNGYGMATVDM